MIVAQISDLRIKAEGRLEYPAIDTAQYLQRAVACIMHLDPRPDLVIASGDLTDAAHHDEYARLRRLLEPLPMPCYLAIGNRDKRETLLPAFLGHAYLRADARFVQYVVESDLRIIVADTTTTGNGGCALDGARIAFIDAALAAKPSRPAMLVLNHPPFATGLSAMDAPEFRGAAQLAAVVQRHPQLVLITCGHMHRTIVTRWGGTVAMTLPSVAYQSVLDVRSDTETLSPEPPAFVLHRWESGTLVSHIVLVDPRRRRVSSLPDPDRDLAGRRS